MKKFIIGSLFVVNSLFAGNNNVLVEVNGKKITIEDVNSYLSNKHVQYTYSQLPQKYKQLILNQIINSVLVIQEAEKSGIENTAEFKKALQVAKKILAQNLFLKQKYDNIYVSDKEIKKFYDKNKDIMFKHTAEVKASHILVKTRAEAEKIIKELENIPMKDRSKKFAELAKTYSIGPSAAVGGELGWFSKGKMLPAFSKAAFSLAKGEFTKEPVHTRFGWHIIYVTDKKQSGYIPLNEVKAKIISIIKKQKLKKYIESLTKKANIQYK